MRDRLQSARSDVRGAGGFCSLLQRHSVGLDGTPSRECFEEDQSPVAAEADLVLLNP